MPMTALGISGVAFPSSPTMGGDDADSVAVASSGLLFTVARLTAFDGTDFDRVRTVGGVADGAAGVGMLAAGPYQYNPTTSQWERARGNSNVTLLTSAARTASTTSAAQTNVSARGVYLTLEVTANPGGAQTLQLAVEAGDNATGTFRTMVTGTATTLLGGTGLVSLLVYPGALDADMVTGDREARAIALPRSWQARVNHSGAGSWTYSLSGAVIL